MFTRVASSGGWEPYPAYGGFIEQGPFHWLLAYLSAAPEGRSRLRFAALSRALGWLDSRSVQDPAFREAVLQDVRSRLPEVVHAEWDGSKEAPSILGGWLPSTRSAAEAEVVDLAVCLPRNAM